MASEDFVVKYIENKNLEIENALTLTSNSTGRKKAQYSYLVALMLAFFASYIVGSAIDGLNNRIYVKNGTGTISNVEDLKYKNSYQIYQEQNLGNDVNTIINGGLTAYKEQLQIMPSQDLQKTIVESDDSSYALGNGLCSNICILDDKIWYIDGSNASLYKCNLDGSDVELILEDVGKAQAVKDFIFFLHDNNLYRCGFSGEDDFLIAEDNISEFVFLGGDILYRTYDRELKRITNASGEYANATMIAASIDAFYYNGDVVALNGNDVIKFEVDKSNMTTIAQNVSGLLGTDYGHIYYQMGSNIYDYCEDTNEAILLASCPDIPVSIDCLNGKIYLLTLQHTENDGYVYNFDCIGD